MIASGPPPNRLLQMFAAADFDLLRAYLITLELVREAVLGEAGAAQGAAVTNEPIANISRREHDGTCPRRGKSGLGDGRCSGG